MKRAFGLSCLLFATSLATFALSGAPATKAETPKPEKPPATTPKPGATATKGGAKTEAGLVRLSPDGDVWLDKVNKRLVMDGEVCLREGQLEMFACLKNTKEHESIVAVKTKAFVVHAALLALGAKVGNVVQFDPKYVPASGTIIDITLEWTDKEGKARKARGQDWVQDAKTKKPLTANWVFAGSSFWTDDAGAKHYNAESGDFVCVSNFPSAMLDLPIESPQANDDLLFTAATEVVPPRGTKVKMYLTPRLEAKPAATTPKATR